MEVIFTEIMIRFNDVDDFNEFKHLIGFNITKKTLSLSLPEGKIINKNEAPKKVRKVKKKPAEWVGMPEYKMEHVEVYAEIRLIIKDEDTLIWLSHKINQPLHKNTKSIRHPRFIRNEKSDYEYRSDINHKPKYGIYIISKGRHDICETHHALKSLGVPHNVVVEYTEYDKYKQYVDEDSLLKLPFHDLGQGSIPARNWVWEHSKSKGEKRHWIMDDNLRAFYRTNDCFRYRLKSGNFIRAFEDFVDRYENIAMAGLNYMTFCIPDGKRPPAPYMTNTRIYSCILLLNDVEQRWRGRYNEDTDLSLCLMKEGYCTLLSNVFLADKKATMCMRGGNTDNVYVDGDKRLKFAKSLQKQHPDVVDVVWKFGRWHHNVNYKKFKNKLILKDKEILKTPNEYDMYLKNINED